jgi:hypothetical protein
LFCRLRHFAEPLVERHAAATYSRVGRLISTGPPTCSMGADDFRNQRGWEILCHLGVLAHVNHGHANTATTVVVYFLPNSLSMSVSLSST